MEEDSALIQLEGEMSLELERQDTKHLFVVFTLDAGTKRRDGVFEDGLVGESGRRDGPAALVVREEEGFVAIAEAFARAR